MSSMDCAVALSSSISKTRMPVPFLAASGSGRHAASGPLVTPWDNLIRHATGQWLTKTDSRVQAFPREVCAARFNTLWETSFLATFRLMRHIRNRGQPIRAVRQSGRAAIAQDSGTQCLTKRVNVGLRDGRRVAQERAIRRFAPKKPKTNVVPVGLPSVGRRARRAPRHAKPVNPAGV